MGTRLKIVITCLLSGPTPVTELVVGKVYKNVTLITVVKVMLFLKVDC